MASKKHIAVIAGDGIGKEVIPQAVKVMQAAEAVVDFTSFDWGADRYLADKVTVPPDGFAMLARDFDAILAGAFGDPRVPSNIHAKEILLGMRSQMDLYANVRPVRLMDASLCPLKGVEPQDVDFVVIRENTEGVYGDLGGVFKRGTPDEIAIQEDVNTRKGVERIIRYAFDYCVNNKKVDGSSRRRVLMCDKSNAMTHAGGLWQRVFKEVATEYPQIETQHMYVDALCLQMVRDRGALTSSLPTICLATSSPTSPRDCRAAWGWRPVPICIRARLQCSSRFTAPLRRLQGKISRIRSAQF